MDLLAGGDEITVAVLTVSDRCFAKISEDKSGSSIVAAINEGLIPNSKVIWKSVVADNIQQIQDAIMTVCDSLKVNVLITTGGTGLSKRDVTPEATKPLLHREIPSFSIKMIVDGIQKTPFAALSRGLAGVRNQTLIINVPGSPKGALENLTSLSPLISHSIQLILDMKIAVASMHGEGSFNKEVKSKVLVNKAEASRIRNSKYPMLEMSDIPRIFQENIDRFPAVIIESEKSAGFVLAEKVIATENLPIEPTSMKDGYIIFEYSAGLNDSPVYDVVGELKPGDSVPDAIGKSSNLIAIKVSTGSCVPASTFAVVPVEDTVVQPNGLSITLKRKPKQGEDIRPPGSDLKKGAVALDRHTILGPPEIGVLASVSLNSVSVIGKPTVAIISTGDELQDSWEHAVPQKIRDCNRPVLLQLLKQWGFKTVDLHIAKDSPDILLSALWSGFQNADVVISTGGMSMGERDLLKEILETDFSATIHFGRLRMKPGKPTGFATLNFCGKKKYWFGLPGNPASAYVMAHLIVLPSLRIMCGWSKNIFLRRIYAEIQDDIRCDPERIEFLRGVLFYENEEGDIYICPRVETTGRNVQQSSCIRGCSYANCFIETPSGGGIISQGTRVVVHLIP